MLGHGKDFILKTSTRFILSKAKGKKDPNQDFSLGHEELGELPDT